MARLSWCRPSEHRLKEVRLPSYRPAVRLSEFLRVEAHRLEAHRVGAHPLETYRLEFLLYEYHRSEARLSRSLPLDYPPAGALLHGSRQPNCSPGSSLRERAKVMR